MQSKFGERYLDLVVTFTPIFRNMAQREVYETPDEPSSGGAITSLITKLNSEGPTSVCAVPVAPNSLESRV